MELCWSDSDNEEECKPRKRLNFEGLESYLSKYIKSEEKTMKLEQDEFKVDVYQSFLPTTSTAKRTEEILGGLMYSQGKMKETVQKIMILTRNKYSFLKRKSTRNRNTMNHVVL